MPLIIRSLASSDQVAARQLILAGLGEHFGWIDQYFSLALEVEDQER